MSKNFPAGNDIVCEKKKKNMYYAICETFISS